MDLISSKIFLLQNENVPSFNFSWLGPHFPLEKCGNENYFYVIVLQILKTLFMSSWILYCFFSFSSMSSRLLKAVCKILHKTWHRVVTQCMLDGWMYRSVQRTSATVLLSKKLCWTIIYYTYSLAFVKLLNFCQAIYQVLYMHISALYLHNNSMM